MATTEDTGDVSGVELTLSKSDLVAALLPEIINELATNATLQNALVNAIMPGLRSQMLQLARTTVSTGTVTGPKR
jgi:hypothetical protein